MASASFQQFISRARERRDNQAAAERIFSRDHRQSAPSQQQQKFSPGGSLASRVGVKKRIPTGPRFSASARHTDDDWTHDLFPYRDDDNDSSDLDHNGTHPRNSASSLGSSTRRPRNQSARQANLARGLERAARDARLSHQIELVSPPSQKQPPQGPRAQQAQLKQQQQQQERIRGISIRGLAGPYSVMAQNFAPGTSAADIESAMTPVGGEMLECRILKTSPIMVVEMVFVSKEGASAVVEGFNNKTADGRVIKVYHKVGGYIPNPPPSYDSQTPLNVSEPRRTDSWRKDDTATRQAVDGDADLDEPNGTRRGRYHDDSIVSDDNRDAVRGNGNRNGAADAARGRDRNWTTTRDRPASERLYSIDVVGSDRRDRAYDSRNGAPRGYNRR